MNIYTLNDRFSKNMKQKLIELKGLTDNSTIIEESSISHFLLYVKQLDIGSIRNRKLK